VRFARHAAFLTPCLDAALAGRPLDVSIDPAFAQRPGVCEFLDARVSSFDLSLGGGIAALGVVSGQTAEQVHDHADALRRAISVAVTEGQAG
jgi:hypothetical protein